MECQVVDGALLTAEGALTGMAGQAMEEDVRRRGRHAGRGRKVVATSVPRQMDDGMAHIHHQHSDRQPHHWTPVGEANSQSSTGAAEPSAAFTSSASPWL